MTCETCSATLKLILNVVRAAPIILQYLYKTTHITIDDSCMYRDVIPLSNTYI